MTAHGTDDRARAAGRTFLAAFLRGDVLERATRQLDERFVGRPDEVVEALRISRSLVHEHAKVTVGAELSALLVDLRLSTDDIADVLDLDPMGVRRIALREGLDDLDAAPSQEVDLESRARRLSGATWRRWAVPVGLALGALALIVVLGGSGGGSLRVEEARMTETVDRTGAPGEPRTRFTVGDDVLLWFSYEAEGDADRVSITWWRQRRDGQATLYTDRNIPLEPGEGRTANVALSSLYSDEPGSYRVQLTRGDEVLTDLEFTIEPG
ncbi:MAG: hypothetical protein KY469_16980 [Actinobacteria bacterium]|nr:hypothetical protein [Actinomycetota bacterium]